MYTARHDRGNNHEHGRDVRTLEYHELTLLLLLLLLHDDDDGRSGGRRAQLYGRSGRARAAGDGNDMICHRQKRTAALSYLYYDSI